METLSLSKLESADIWISLASESNFFMSAWNSALANFIEKNQGKLSCRSHCAIGKLILE